MIEFIEKEPWYNSNPFTGGCNMYPTFMVKDGNEFFMFNRREPDDKWKLEEDELRKKHLKSTNGAYFKFYGLYDSPFEMLKEISERKCHFTEPKDTYCCSIDKHTFIDFHGNLKEVSAAFRYRIYDSDIEKTIRKAVELINDEKFEECEKFISDYIKA